MKIEGVHTETNVTEVATWLAEAKSVVIVPGYGLAVSKGQYAIADIVKMLREKGVKVCDVIVAEVVMS